MLLPICKPDSIRVEIDRILKKQVFILKSASIPSNCSMDLAYSKTSPYSVCDTNTILSIQFLPDPKLPFIFHAEIETQSRRQLTLSSSNSIASIFPRPKSSQSTIKISFSNLFKDNMKRIGNWLQYRIQPIPEWQDFQIDLFECLNLFDLNVVPVGIKKITVCANMKFRQAEIINQPNSPVRMILDQLKIVHFPYRDENIIEEIHSDDTENHSLPKKDILEMGSDGSKPDAHYRLTRLTCYDQDSLLILSDDGLEISRFLLKRDSPPSVVLRSDVKIVDFRCLSNAPILFVLTEDRKLRVYDHFKLIQNANLSEIENFACTPDNHLITISKGTRQSTISLYSLQYPAGGLKFLNSINTSKFSWTDLVCIGNSSFLVLCSDGVARLLTIEKNRLIVNAKKGSLNGIKRLVRSNLEKSPVVAVLERDKDLDGKYLFIDKDLNVFWEMPNAKALKKVVGYGMRCYLMFEGDTGQAEIREVNFETKQEEVSDISGKDIQDLSFDAEGRNLWGLAKDGKVCCLTEHVSELEDNRDVALRSSEESVKVSSEDDNTEEEEKSSPPPPMLEIAPCPASEPFHLVPNPPHYEIIHGIHTNPQSFIWLPEKQQLIFGLGRIIQILSLKSPPSPAILLNLRGPNEGQVSANTVIRISPHHRYLFVANAGALSVISNISEESPTVLFTEFHDLNVSLAEFLCETKLVLLTDRFELIVFQITGHNSFKLISCTEKLTDLRKSTSNYLKFPVIFPLSMTNFVTCFDHSVREWHITDENELEFLDWSVPAGDLQAIVKIKAVEPLDLVALLMKSSNEVGIYDVANDSIVKRVKIPSDQPIIRMYEVPPGKHSKSVYVVLLLESNGSCYFMEFTEVDCSISKIIGMDLTDPESNWFQCAWRQTEFLDELECLTCSVFGMKYLNLTRKVQSELFAAPLTGVQSLVNCTTEPSIMAISNQTNSRLIKVTSSSADVSVTELGLVKVTGFTVIAVCFLSTEVLLISTDNGLLLFYSIKQNLYSHFYQHEPFPVAGNSGEIRVITAMQCFTSVPRTSSKKLVLAGTNTGVFGSFYIDLDNLVSVKFLKLGISRLLNSEICSIAINGEFFSCGLTSGEVWVGSRTQPNKANIARTIRVYKPEKIGDKLPVIMAINSFGLVAVGCLNSNIRVFDITRTSKSVDYVISVPASLSLFSLGFKTDQMLIFTTVDGQGGEISIEKEPIKGLEHCALYVLPSETALIASNHSIAVCSTDGTVIKL
jgi:hypothetical protein